MSKSRNITMLLCLLLISGCAAFSPNDLVKPSEVTLVQALASVGAGLNGMREAQKDMKTGLIAESVEVTFNLAASAKESGKLTIDLSKTVSGDPVSRARTIGTEHERSSDANRSNAITIKFVNILTIPKDTLAYSKSPEELGKIILIPAAGGWTTFGNGISTQQAFDALNIQTKE